MKHWTDPLKFPVFIEGRETPDAAWETFFTAQTPIDMEYRMGAYTFPAFPLLRMRDSAQQTFELTQKEILDFHEKTLEHTQQDIEPLRAFAQSAPEASLETAQELVGAGLAAKHFFIAPNSQVTLEHPHLHHLKITEFEDSVICNIHITDAPATGTEPSVTLWKADRKFSVTPEGLGLEIEAFLVLLCAAIIRDFWVLETRARQRTYQTRTEKKRERQGTGKSRKRVVTKEWTFIPRFQYDLNAYQSHPRKVSHEVRVTLSPHLVSGHLRKLPEGWKRSETAEKTATEFGIQLEDGQTFVKPYKKGEVEQMRTYRSRSALELLFEKPE